MTPAFLLDANVFIEAKNRYYSFDVFPAFWRWLYEQQAAGQLASVQLVGDELERGRDALADWAKKRRTRGWFLAVDDGATQQALSEIANWVMGQTGLLPTAKEAFLACSDPWLIAKARVLGAAVVTHETFDPQSRRKVKIPNVCQPFGVTYLTTFELLAQLKAKF
jgi:hypothetical protein